MGREEAGSVRWCWAVREISTVVNDDEDQTSQRSGYCQLQSASVAHFGAW
jgi:hypothetical protein